MAKEEHVALPIWIVIIETLEATHGTEPVGTDGPGKTRHEKMRHSRGACTGIGSRIKQGLPSAVAVVLNPQPIASNILGNLWRVVWVIRAEPGSHLKSDSLDPFVLYLGERLDVDVS